MNAAGLRLDQAPPISVPLRFFLTAPVFPIVAALLLAWQGPEALASRWSPAMLALTHLFTLGFLTMTMVGALMQLLPVLVGSPLTRPMAVGALVHVLLVLGTVALGAGFMADRAGLLRLALALLGGGFALFIATVATSLVRAKAVNSTVSAMRLALVALLVTVLLGLSLAWFSGERSAIPSGYTWTNLHLAWGLIGWVSALVIGVAYQVVPMFQLTPPYPAWLRKILAPGVFTALLGWSVATFAASRNAAFSSVADVLAIITATGLATFAFITWRLQRQRRRRLPDATMRFWQMAMGCLLASVALGLAAWVSGESHPRLGLLLGAWMIVGFASSVIHGMLYKIVPFLVWLHLHAQNIRYTLPNMKEILPDTRTMPHVWLHGIALVLLCAAILHPAGLVYPAAATVALSYAWLGGNLWSAYRLYRRTARAASRERNHVA